MLNFRRCLLVAVPVIAFLLTANVLHAAGQSSTNYQIPTDVISGGGDGGGSANYSVGHTTGQSTAIGESTSTNYKNQAGFWYTFLGIASGDTDGDGIPDGDGTNPCTGGNTVNCDDNCVNTANADQADTDADGAGDLCDNCKLVKNADQRDDNALQDDNTNILKPGDQHYGDACDPDFDNDGLVTLTDYAEWRKWYRQAVPPAPAYVDLDNDNLIGLSDYAVWRKYYRGVPGPGIE